MKFLRLVGLGCGILLIVLTLTAGSSKLAPSPVTVLFVGNSLTYTKNMPAIFKRYAESAYPGTSVEISMIAPPGESLAGHRRSGNVQAEITNDHWDFVVLQDRPSAHSWTLNGVPHMSPPDAYVDDVKFFADAVHSRSGRPILLQLWGPPQGDARSYIDYETFMAADATGSGVAPAGSVWRSLDGRLSGSLLDGSHPSELGATIVAVTIAQSIFGAPRHVGEYPVGLGSADIAAIEAAARRETSAIAKGVVVPPRPVYLSEPTIVASDAPPIGRYVGTWRARRGATRLSFGTEITVAAGSVDAPKVLVREYTLNEPLTLDVTDVEFHQGVLAFRVRSSAVLFSFRLVVSDDGKSIEALALKGQDATRREFNSARYYRDGDAAYFRSLDRLYKIRARDEHKVGLAAALSEHYKRMEELVGNEQFKLAHDGFPLTEWDQLMTGWFYADSSPQRASEYYRAASVMHPESVRARVQLAEILIEMGQGEGAAGALAEAQKLNDKSATGPDQEMDSEIRRLELQLSDTHQGGGSK